AGVRSRRTAGAPISGSSRGTATTCSSHSADPAARGCVAGPSSPEWRVPGNLTAAVVFAGLLAAGAAFSATQQEIEESLTCQCGCGLTVHSCNHLQCPSGEPIKKEIAD